MVSGTDYVGGLIGHSGSSTITSCYTTAEVTGNDYVGGFTGNSGNNTITSCYATGAVDGNLNVGGFSARASGSTVDSCYWNKETSLQNSVDGTGITTTDLMVAQASYNDSYWDFTSTPDWKIVEGVTYPYLAWQDLPAAPRYSGGTGNDEEPYQIANLPELKLLSETLDDWAAGLYFILTADIDASDTSTWYEGAGFSPIGIDLYPLGGTYYFRGNFDGREHVISDVYINRLTQESVGLFGLTLTGSSVTNLGLEGGTINGLGYVGGLVGSSSSTITSCFSTVAVTGTNNYVGGLVGFQSGGSIDDCYARGAVWGSGHIGGLVGAINGTITTSYSTGAVRVTANSGGLVGSGAGAVSLSYWNTETSNQVSSAGGAGATGLDSEAMVLQSAFAGFDFTTPDWKIVGGYTFPYLAWQDMPAAIQYAGGAGTGFDPYKIESLAGLRLLSETSDDWAVGKSFILTADIDASDTSNWNDGAGFSPIGDSGVKFEGSFDGQGNIISNLYINRPAQDICGYFGITGSSARISYLGIENGTIIGQSHLGGLLGYNEGGTITSCHFSGSVSGNYYVGGLIGTNFLSGTVTASYATGSVSGFSKVGGLVGYHPSGTITFCYATGDTSGTQNIGGLIGDNQGAVNNCYATGAASGTNYIGGLIGTNLSTVTICYSIGAVSGSTNVGGLMGATSGGTVYSCYWDTEASGQANSVEGTGRTSLEMLFEDSFTGFDFNNDPLWAIDEGDTRPYLAWQTSNFPFGDVVYTAFDFVGEATNGLYATPYALIGNAVFNVASGGLLVLKSGESSEQLTLSKPMRIESLSTVRIGVE